jgi:hypothetical protein
MNTLIIIALLTAVLFLCLYIAYLKGYRLTKLTPTQISQDEKQKTERLQKEFDMMMNYNLSQALERRRA